VIVELCPAQSSATANSRPASPVPRSGLRSRCASRRSVTTRPASWNTPAASTRIDALASPSAMQRFASACRRSETAAAMRTRCLRR
jgi:hypothetical protein